jgi:predicted MFS family arabinose efflux permease
VNAAAERVRAPSWLLPFAATLMAMFALQLSNLGFPPLLPSLQSDLGMNYTQLGLFTGLYGLLAMLLSVPAGLLARRFGEKRVLVLGLVGVAAGSLLLGLAQNFATGIAFRGLTIFGYRFAFVCVLIDGLGWRVAVQGYAAMAVLGAVVFWLFYRPLPDAAPAQPAHGPSGATPAGAFRSPAVWLVALVVGLGGFGQFTVTHFVPSVAAVHGLDATAAGFILSTGYLAAIFVNLVVGVLADRYDKVVVLGVMFVLLAAASASLNLPGEAAFRVATAAVISLGFAATNQLYGLAGSLLPREQVGPAMGIVSLGAGLFGFFGPQLLGILRDLTGTFEAGFYMVMSADLVTILLLVVLYRLTRRSA